MAESSLFRPEALKSANGRLDGRVSIIVPLPIWAVSALLCLIMAYAITLAANATYARKEVARGWISWSVDMARVRAPRNSVIDAISVSEGDWVKEGQLLAWADGSRIASTISPTVTRMPITAPISGQVVLSQASPGVVSNGDTVLFIIAPESGHLQARLLVPTRGVAFVEVGQTIKLALDAFPYQRFGMISARVTRVSGSAITPGQAEVPFEFAESSFIVDADLQRTSISAYQKEAQVEASMLLTGHIITDRRTLLEMLFDPLFAAGKLSRE